MYTKEELSVAIEDYIANLDFPSCPEALYQPIGYSLESGGKRIRPLLTMMSCNIFSDDVTPAMPCAAAVEVFHNFTLLHDDIMDNASVRRGRPSVHRKWSTNTAILSGDAMTICAYRLLERTDQAILSQILHIFNHTSLKVCEGQQYDMDFEQRDDVSMNEYIEMIALKTAFLLAGATTMGAVAGGASDEDCRRLHSFAMDTGLAFQIQDDLLDTYGTEEVLGKKIGGDITEGKKTFLTIAAYEAADSATRNRLSSLLKDREIDPAAKIAEVKALYDSLDVRERAIKAVTEYTAKAIASLEMVSAPAERLKGMRSLAISLTNRIS